MLAVAGEETEITVTVTPESVDDADVKIYTITVYRTRVAPSADASSVFVWQ